MTTRPPSKPVKVTDVLVRTALGGDKEAFEALYRAFGPRLMASAWRLAGGNRALAEDWVQDAFVQAWNKGASLREPGAFGGWIRRLLINIALMDMRRSRLVDMEPEQESAGVEPPWPCLDRDLEQAIAALPDRARMVLVLFHLEDFSHEEIARRLGVTTGTSKAQLHRARKLIKERLST